MLCGTVPFKAGNMKDLHVLIKKGEFVYPVNISESKYNFEYAVLLFRCERHD
jgi:hypothetical protein